MVLGPIGLCFFVVVVFFLENSELCAENSELCAEILPCVTNRFPGMSGVEGGREPPVCNLPLAGDMEAQSAAQDTFGPLVPASP